MSCMDSYSSRPGWEENNSCCSQPLRPQLQYSLFPVPTHPLAWISPRTWFNLEHRAQMRRRKCGGAATSIFISCGFWWLCFVFLLAVLGPGEKVHLEDGNYSQGLFILPSKLDSPQLFRDRLSSLRTLWEFCFFPFFSLVASVLTVPSLCWQVQDWP